MEGFWFEPPSCNSSGNSSLTSQQQQQQQQALLSPGLKYIDFHLPLVISRAIRGGR